MKKILVVDDDPDCSLFLKKILEHYGCEVVIQDSGRTAILALTEEIFDGVFLDISLMDMDGFAVAKKARETLGDSFPIIALTGYPLEVLKKQNPEVEKIFSDISIKPANIQSLFNIVQKFFK